MLSSAIAKLHQEKPSKLLFWQPPWYNSHPATPPISDTHHPSTNKQSNSQPLPKTSTSTVFSFVLLTIRRSLGFHQCKINHPTSFHPTPWTKYDQIRPSSMTLCWVIKTHPKFFKDKPKPKPNTNLVSLNYPSKDKFSELA